VALNFLKTLDADDIFISYSRDDGEAYLTGLDAALSARGFSCFTDRRGTKADPLPPEELFQKIRACKTLVLLGTPGALKRPKNITPELKNFADSNGTARIIPVSFDRGQEFTDFPEAWHAFVVGKAREREDPAARATGAPSPAVVAAVAAASDYMKSKDRLRMYRNRTAAGVLSLLALGLVAVGLAIYGFWRAAKAMNDAHVVQEQADRTIAKAKDDTAKAVEQSQKDIQKAKGDAQREIDDAQKEARTKITQADALAKAADDKRAAAEAARREAQSAAAKEQTIAHATSLVNRSQTLLRRYPERLPLSVSTAAEALAESSGAGVRSPEFDAALRESLSLLPYLGRVDKYPGAVLALSPSSLHTAAFTGKGRLGVYAEGGARLLKDFSCTCEAVAVSDDPVRVASAHERTVVAYDLKDDRFITITLPSTPADAYGHPIIKHLALSPDGRYLAATLNSLLDEPTDRSTVIVAEVESGQVIERFDNLDIYASDIAFGPSGALAVGGVSPVVGPRLNLLGKAIIWPLLKVGADPAQIKANLMHYYDETLDGPVEAIALSPDSSYFATEKGVWAEWRSGAPPELIARIPAAADNSQPPGYSIDDLAFSPDGQQLFVVRLTLTTNKEVSFGVEHWGVTGYPVSARANLDPDFTEVIGVAFLPGGERLAVVTNAAEAARRVQLFQFAGGSEMKPAAPPAPKDWYVNYVSPDARFIIYASLKGQELLIRDVWMSQSYPLSYAHDLQGHAGVTLMNASGSLIALTGQAADGSGQVALFYRLDRDVYHPTASRLGLEEGVAQVTLSPAGDLLMTQAKGRARVREVAGGRDVAPPGLEKLAQIESASFSPDGRYLVAVVKAGARETLYDIHAWRLASPKEVVTMTGVHRLTALAFSPLGHYLFTASDDKTARLTRLADGYTRPLGGDYQALAAAFSGDERQLAVGSDDGLLRLLLTDDPDHELARLQHGARVAAVTFGDGDKFLAAAGGGGPTSYYKDYQVRVWMLRPGDLVGEANRRLAQLDRLAPYLR
jgi:WD40 repeat protein/F0F1-type ATP synthase membrane subunit b/b'